MRTLYGLSTEYADLLESIYDSTDDGDGEISEENTARLAALDGEIAGKLESCCRVMRDLAASQAACSYEADRLAKRARALDRHGEWLKNYMKTCMESAHIDNINAGPFRLSVCHSVGKVEVTNVDAVPTMFDVPQERKLSLSAIRVALVRGDTVPGAQLVRGTHLRVT